MPFACQPAIHNPVATVERQAAVMFAGAFYRRYPERNQDLESMVDELAPVYDIDIYDRNFGSELEDYRFPDRYAEHIRGTLAPGDVPEAYKRYRFGLNMNSVKQSTTMFARRVFELMGSGTLVLGTTPAASARCSATSRSPWTTGQRARADRSPQRAGRPQEAARRVAQGPGRAHLRGPVLLPPVQDHRGRLRRTRPSVAVLVDARGRARPGESRGRPGRAAGCASGRIPVERHRPAAVPLGCRRGAHGCAGERRPSSTTLRLRHGVAAG